MTKWWKIKVIANAGAWGFCFAHLVGEPETADLSVVLFMLISMFYILYKIWNEGEFSPS